MLIFGQIATNVSVLGEVWEKASLNFRLKTELYKDKTNFKLSLKPKSCQTPVMPSAFYLLQFSV